MLQRTTIPLPTVQGVPDVPQRIDVLFLAAYENWNHPCCYLQHVRERKVYVYEYEDAELRTKIRAEEYQYYAALDNLRSQFAAEIATSEPQIDLLVDPPSNTHLHRPYISAIRERLPHVDSICFVKHDHSSSSEHGATVSGLYDSMHLRAPEDTRRRLPHKRCVLIVDDVVSTGKTVAAIVRHLRRCIVDPHSRFLLACPLLIAPSDSAPMLP